MTERGWYYVDDEGYSGVLLPFGSGWRHLTSLDEFTAAEWGMDLGGNSIDEIEYVIRDGRKGGLAIGFTLEDDRNPEALSRVIGALNKELLQQIRAEVEEAIS